VTADWEESRRVELAPLRPILIVHGLLSIGTSVVGLAVGLPFAKHPVLSAWVAGGGAVVFGLIFTLSWRASLKRVAAPLPPDAYVVERQSSRYLGLRVAIVTVLLALVVIGFVGPAVFGFGVGVGAAFLWAAARVRRFESKDGRRILRRVGPRVTGQPTFYAG
jgi:hypothetical protein